MTSEANTNGVKTPEPGRRPRRSWPRRVLRVSLFATGVLFLLAALALLLLSTGPGEQLALKIAVEAVNKAIPGTMSAGEVDVTGDAVTLRNLKLVTPEGEVVAEVAEVTANVSLRALARREIRIQVGEVIRPRAWLVQEPERGLNLLRAVVDPDRERTPDEGQPSRIVVTIQNARIVDGLAEYVLVDEDGERRTWRLEGLEAAGGFELDGPSDSMDLDGTLTGRMTEPTEAPLAITFRGRKEGESRQQATVDLTLGELAVKGELVQTDERSASARLEHVHVPPGLARALLPGWPLQVPLTVEGDASIASRVVRAKLEATAGRGEAQIEGDFELDDFTSTGMRIVASRLDLSELFPDGPNTALSFEADASGGGRTLETLTGALRLRATPSMLDNQSIGPLRLDASVKLGALELRELDLTMPGARLTASGGGTLSALDIQGTFRGFDLKRTARMFGDLTPGRPPPLAGRGRLDFSLEGSAREPGIRAEGHFPQLAFGGLAAQELRVKGAIPNVTRPLETDATLAIAALEVDARTFRDLAVDITTRDRLLTLEGNTAGFADLRLRVEGLRDEDGDGLALRALTLTYPEATWNLEGSSHLRFEDGDLMLRPLTLRSGDQRLTVEGRLVGKQLTAQVSADALTLETLPSVFIPEAWQLAGRVRLSATVEGRLPRPAATLELTLEGGRFREVTGVALQIDAAYRKDRLSGTLSVALPQAAASSKFDLPVTALLETRRAPMALSVVLERLELTDTVLLARRFGGKEAPTPSLQGQLSGALTVTGSADDPRATLELSGRNLQDPLWLPQDVGIDLRVTSDPLTGGLSAAAEVIGLGRNGLVRLDTPLTLRELRRKPPTGEALLDTPVKLEARLENVPLRALSTLGANFRAGAVTLALTGEGSARAPRGQLRASFVGASLDESAPFSGVLTVAAGERRVDLGLNAKLDSGAERGARILAVTARTESPLGALFDPARLARAPLDVKAELGPVRLRALPFFALTEEERENLVEQPLDGTVDAKLSLTGTLTDPKLIFEGHGDSLGIGELAIGKARLDARYQNARPAAELQVIAPQGGKLEARAVLGLDLSFEALKKGVTTSRVPLEGRVIAKKFDLSFLSGITPMIRRLGGAVDADATIAGTLGAPTYTGKLAVKDGVLSLFGYGEYREIQLALAVTRERITLSRLSAKSGPGELYFEARANRQGDQYQLTGEGMLKRFPIVVDDQPYANVSLRTTFRGELSQRLVNIRELAIPEATIELPETGRRDLQALDRPDDIVLVRNDIPVDPRIRKKERDARLALELGKDPKATPESTAAGPVDEGKRQYWVTVNAPRNLWVRGADVNAEIGLSEEFRIEYVERVVLFGEIRLLQGRVDVFGRKFEVQRDSQIRFTGPAKTPYLNITATYSSESGPEPVTVFITIRGQGKDFTFRATSQPPLPESEIYTLLATGRRTLKRGSGASLTGADAASVVGSLAASQLRRNLAKELPLDVLSIEAGEEGFRDARVEAGTYLTDELYLGYTYKAGADPGRGENSNAVRIEYQLSPRWSLEGVFGDVRREADLIWSREY